MSKSRKILLGLAIVVMLLSGVAAWATVRVVSWLQDMPNRIVFDGGTAEALSTAVTDYYHLTFREGDPASQVDLLRSFRDADEDPDFRDWVRNRFSAEIINLQSSESEDVATLATQVVERFDLKSPSTVDQDDLPNPF